MMWSVLDDGYFTHSRQMVKQPSQNIFGNIMEGSIAKKSSAPPEWRKD